MSTIFDSCTPREDILSGDLREDMFAAQLGDVIDGKADPIYNDAVLFFNNTYPTTGLRTLVGEVFARLSGQADGRAVIRLETSFGGGKTHNLIALYHLARNPAAAAAGSPSSSLIVPRVEELGVAGAVGSDLELEGLDHGDAKTHTLWGEIAYRLGGSAGYQLVGQSDEQGGPAPGCQFLGQILGDKPALIMLDEIARHLRSARAKQVVDSTLAEQTVAFLMSLFEFAAGRRGTVVVFTLAGPQDAFSKETELLARELTEAKSVAARRELVLTPAAEDERPAIVSHRLFQKVDMQAAEDVGRQYLEYYTKVAQQGGELPERAHRADYAKDIRLHYPFHPELLLTLNRKTSTIPNFQSTRGALRLLALTVRGLWSVRPANTYLIHPYHLDLANEAVVNDLTTRLDRPTFRQVVEADIASPVPGSRSHSAVVDEEFVAAGKPPYALRASTTVFLHSLTQGVASGVDPAGLNLAVLQPDDDVALLAKAIERLVDCCWFLEWDGRHYRFKTEPSLNKIIADEMTTVGRTAAKNQLDSHIQSVWKKGFLHPKFFPSEAGEVDDDSTEPKVVILHYDAAAVESTEGGPPELVRKIFDYAGSLAGYRVFKNNLVFLVAEKDQVERTVDLTRRYIAIGRIIGDADRMNDFNEEQRKKLRAMHDSAELEMRVAITRTYSHLFYPSSDAPEQYGHLQHEALPAQEQGEVKQDQTQVLLRVLKGLDKVLTGDDPPLPPAFVRAKAWPSGRESVSTEDLRKAFAQRVGLKMLLDINQLKATIKTGISGGAWVYYDTKEQMGYGKDSPAPLVQIGEDFELYTPAEAERIDLPIKGKERAPEICPV
ncbi:MAG: DUF499 domain-containing protein, partial [Bacillota bacterium]|nr:DUF499 domain-containing protein [Bacillota bacterium]